VRGEGHKPEMFKENEQGIDKFELAHIKQELAERQPSRRERQPSRRRV
jgi:hypothetical protein